MDDFGDRLYKKVYFSKGAIYLQGEFLQLSYQAFGRYLEYIEGSSELSIPVRYPVGMRNDSTPILSTYEISKDDLYKKYNYLSEAQLPINGIYQLVTIIENLLVDILREVLLQFPNKISSKKKFDYEIFITSNSLDEIKSTIINSIINELTYKSPKDFAEDFKNYIGLDLTKAIAFDNYIEIKATRDIHIHNQGVANDIYRSKAGTFARVNPGKNLPVDKKYFLQSYEWCIQLIGFIEKGINDIWPSSIYQTIQGIVNDKTKTREQILIESAAIDLRIRE